MNYFDIVTPDRWQSYPAGLAGPNLRTGRDVIAEGAYADLILVDGNPLENFDLVADPHTRFDLIMKDGVIYKNTLSQ